MTERHIAAACLYNQEGHILLPRFDLHTVGLSDLVRTEEDIERGAPEYELGFSELPLTVANPRRSLTAQLREQLETTYGLRENFSRVIARQVFTEPGSDLRVTCNVYKSPVRSYHELPNKQDWDFVDFKNGRVDGTVTLGRYASMVYQRLQNGEAKLL
jgi:hypothetical protein